MARIIFFRVPESFKPPAAPAHNAQLGKLLVFRGQQTRLEEAAKVSVCAETARNS